MVNIAQISTQQPPPASVEINTAGTTGTPGNVQFTEVLMVAALVFAVIFFARK